jgi:hypothetical protein
MAIAAILFYLLAAKRSTIVKKHPIVLTPAS